MKKEIKKAYFYGTWLIKFSFLISFYLIVSLPLRFSRKYKNLWIIGERPDEARDNGYWLYKWILENKPDTNVRFVLSKNSVDYKKMPRKDLIVEPGSAKHYICYILSSVAASTHMHGVCPGKSFCIPFLPLMRHKKTVFLQHGIIKDRLKLRVGLDIIIASSKKEKELIIEANPRYINKIYITGLCRYDQLEDLSNEEESKIILVMPTFRRWLRDIGRLKNANDVFRGTDYYRAWSDFLNDERLKEKIEKSNMRLIFFPHMEMQKLVQNINVNSKNIKIGKPGEYDVQDLLKRASILVTDYSSVFFDFVYMNKPVVFYQFDQKDFFSKHYAAADGPYPFGKIFNNRDPLIEEIDKIIDRGCTIDLNYSKDAASFYKFRDNKNCERVFNLVGGSK